MPRKDPFKTLDDPEPKPAAAPDAPQCLSIPADSVGAGTLTTDYRTFTRSAGYWLLPTTERPAWWRRALVRLLLDWKWRDYDTV